MQIFVCSNQFFVLNVHVEQNNPTTYILKMKKKYETNFFLKKIAKVIGSV